MAEEYFEAGGKKIYKRLFTQNPDEYERLKSVFVPGAKESESQWMKKEQEQTKAAIQEMSPVEKTKYVEGIQKEQEQQREAKTAQAQMAAPEPTAQPAAQAKPATPVAQSEQPAGQGGLVPQIVIQTAPEEKRAGPSMISATTTQRQETIMGKKQEEAYKSYTNALSEVQKTGVAEAKLNIEKQKEYGLAAEGIAQRNAENLADIEIRRQKYEEKLATEKASLDTAVEDLKNYQFKEFFQGRQGARVLAGFAMALGSVGSAFTGGPNAAMQIIDSAIQTDLARQKAEFEKVRTGVETQKSLYSQMVAKGMDDFAADKAVYAIRVNQGVEQLEAMKSQISNAEGKAKIEALQAQMKEKAAAAMMEATKGLDVKVITETKPMVLPSAEEKAKSYTAFQEAVAKTPSVKEALDSEAGLRDWQSGGKTAVDVARFIAGPTGLGQGSYGPTFDKMLNDAGLVDRTVQGIEAYFAGGQKEQLIKNIENFLQVRAVESAARSRDYLGPLEDLAERNGMPRDILRKQMNTLGLAREQAKSLGLKPVGKK